MKRRDLIKNSFLTFFGVAAGSALAKENVEMTVKKSAAPSVLIPGGNNLNYHHSQDSPNMINYRVRGSIYQDIPFHCDTIASLRDYKPLYDGQIIHVLSYSHDQTSPLTIFAGGGRFQYIAADTVTADDSLIFIISKGLFRWKRILDSDVITPRMAGAIGDGIKNDDHAFAILSKFLSSQDNHYILDLEGLRYKLTKSIAFDLFKCTVEGKNAVLDFSNIVVHDGNPISCIRINYSSSISSLIKPKFRDCTLIGSGKKKSNLFGIDISPQYGSSNSEFSNLNILDFHKAIVFGSHAYLITFYDLTLKSLICLASSSQGKIVDAGENIRFIGGVFSDSGKFLEFINGEFSLSFIGTSFDYSGDNNGGALFSIGSSHLNFSSCHFEWGNAHRINTGIVFEVKGQGNINVFGGWISIGNTNFVKHPYFFFFEGNGQAAIENTFIYGMGTQKWSNRNLTKFLPQINGASSQVSAYVDESIPYLSDPFFLSETIIDNWSISNDKKTSIPSTIKIISTKESMVKDKSLKALRLVRGNEKGKVFLTLLVKNNSSMFNPFVKICISGLLDVSLQMSLFFCNVFQNIEMSKFNFINTNKIDLKEIKLTSGVFKDVTLGNSTLGLNKFSRASEFVCLSFDVSNLKENDVFLIHSVDYQKAG